MLGKSSFHRIVQTPMFLTIRSLLTQEEVARLQAIAQQMNFVDGKLSNTTHIAKQNLQASRDPRDSMYVESAQIVTNGYVRSREFGNFTLAKQFSQPLMSRYDVGMKYGVHSDSAHLPIPPSTILRTDLSSTVFLNDPSTYGGGELVIHAGDQPITLKMNAGDAVIYPSTWLHEVTEVTSGSRLVSICFIESMIRDQHQRTQMFELKRVAEEERDRMTWDNRMRMEVALQNLLRMWSD